MAKGVNLPDGYLHCVGDHYILQTSSREGYAALVAELGTLPATYIRLDAEHQVDYWFTMFERLGLWLRVSSLPEAQVYGEGYGNGSGSLCSTG